MVPAALGPQSTEAIAVRVYHQCQLAATGSAIGPGTHVSYWWLLDGNLRVVAAPELPELARLALIDAVMGAIGHLDPRRRQDELAEASDA